MTRSVEVKARVRGVAALIERTAVTVGSGPERIEQDDTFSTCANGRPKLRQLLPECGEPIHYFRANSTDPRVSSYHIVPTNAPDALRNTLATIIDATGRVMKMRQLYLTGQTRVHVDAVKDLGDFIELEVVLRGNQPEDDGVAIAHVLVQSLGAAESDLFDVAYAGSLVV